MSETQSTELTDEEKRNKELLQEYIEEVWENGNVDAAEKYLAPDYVEHQLSAGIPDLEGIEAHKQNVERFLTAFPDMEFEIIELVADGDKTTQLFTVRATHEGEFMGAPATGKRAEITAVGITKFEDGKMVEDWSQVDVLSLMEQLGIGPDAP